MSFCLNFKKRYDKANCALKFCFKYEEDMHKFIGDIFKYSTEDVAWEFVIWEVADD